jgi:hypothetical protein
MKRPIIEETELKEKSLFMLINRGLSPHRMATIWQQVEDGVAEQAIHARTWDGGDNKPLVELKQGNESILLNGETLRDLAKLIIGWVG